MKSVWMQSLQPDAKINEGIKNNKNFGSHPDVRLKDGIWLFI
jgi:hypothetical protein